MGDDLTTARRFCDHAKSNMELLMAAISNDSVCAPHILVEYLAQVQSQAKSQHAFAIYRGAQNVIDAALSNAPIERLQGRALSLNKLIVQYQSGLDEIAPAPANAQGTQDVVNGLTPSTPPPFPSAEDAALAVKYKHARAALLPLMNFANQPGEAKALSRLAGFTPSEFSVAAPQGLESGGEAERSESAAMAKTAMAPPNMRNVPAAAKPEIAAAPDVDFESLMPHFTSEALQAARQVQKTVSVSYAAEDVRLSFAQAQALQPVLQHIAQQIVTGVLERPETRRRRGESSAGHIALTASQLGDMVSISLDCPGAPMLVSAFTPQNHSVKGLTITPGEHTSQGLMHIVLSLPARENKADRHKANIAAHPEEAMGAKQAENSDGATLGALTATNNRPASELAL